MHCTTRFFATVSDKRVDLLDKLKPETLESAFQNTLPGDRPIAALYQDTDKEGAVLLVRICISDVGYLHELRDTLLAKTAGSKISKQLAAAWKQCNNPGELKVCLDLTQVSFTAGEWDGFFDSCASCSLLRSMKEACWS